jgi:lycopene beta-cyclase
MERYDYIFAGAGCAGLSLVYYLLESDLKDSKILLIDPQGTSIPDKTWCYWSERPLAIHPEKSVHSWKNLSFVSNGSKITKNLGNLAYYHLNSHDFYHSLFKKLEDFPNVSFLQDEVVSITENHSSVTLLTKSQLALEASIVFDSRLNPDVFHADSKLKQVFSGWRIKTESPAFDPNSLILMEFPDRNSNQFEFFYILPFSETEALVEYTTYAQHPIPESNLNQLLESYLKTNLGDTSFKVSFRESGIIPMSTKIASGPSSNRIIPLGTAAGWTKPSTGYTFHTIQKNCQQIVGQLESGALTQTQYSRSPRFTFYDNILLNIAQKWPGKLQGLFLNLFETSSAALVLRFLSEETSFWEELKLLGKLRFPIFIKSLLRYESH